MKFTISLIALLCCSIAIATPTAAPNDGRPLMDRLVEEGKQIYSSLEKQFPDFLPYKTIYDAFEAGKVENKFSGVNKLKDYQENVFELIENAFDYVDSSPTNISSEQVYQFTKTFLTLLKQRFPDYQVLTSVLEQLELVQNSGLSYGYKNDAASVDNFKSLQRKIFELVRSD